MIIEFSQKPPDTHRKIQTRTCDLLYPHKFPLMILLYQIHSYVHSRYMQKYAEFYKEKR